MDYFNFEELIDTVVIVAALVTIAIMIVVLAKAGLKKAATKAEVYRQNKGPSLQNLKRLETLASLRDNGAISAAEFEAEKAKILR